jgi:predicted  nucleic acid-binding Zn-ribbon protein
LDCDCDDEDVDENDFGFERRFVSKAETLKALEWYLDELQNEAQGVRESIADLKKEMAQAEAETAKAEKPAEPATSKARRTRKKKA